MTNVGYHPNLVNLLGACTENGLYHLSWLNSFTFALVYLCTLFLNPFTAKCGQRKVSTKFPNFIFQNCEKQIVSCESTGTELSFDWSHHRISSTDSKVRVTLQNAIKQSGGERVKMKKIQNCGFQILVMRGCYVIPCHVTSPAVNQRTQSLTRYGERDRNRYNPRKILKSLLNVLYTALLIFSFPNNATYVDYPFHCN